MTIAGYAVTFFYKIQIAPVHFWSMRRFLAVVLPATVLGIAALASEAGRRLAPARAQSTVAGDRRDRCGAAGGVDLLGPVRAGTPSRRICRLDPQARGASRDGIDDRDLLVVESRDAGSDLHTLALPLAYIYARNVLVLASAVPDKRSFETFVLWAQSAYPRVLFLGGGGTDLLTRRVTAAPIASEQFQVPEYDAPTNAYPAGPRRKDFEFSLYALSTTSALPAVRSR
jgi:hypothetical protein